jgi:hypothetical protein
MTTRLEMAYLLLALLVAGAGFAVWWMIRNTERNVRRRNRRERRARYKADMAAEGAEEEAGKPD